MFKQWSLTSMLLVAALATGCAGSGNQTTSEPVVEEPVVVDTTPVVEEPMDTMPVDTPDLSESVVYFAFDSSELTPNAMTVIAEYGRYLASMPSARVRLEGHADERGTREYNIGLGERRALAVQYALKSAGVADSQISVISYGEEKPAVEGSSESSWALNRRVEFVLL